MIDVAVQHAAPWDENEDWEALATTAVLAAFGKSEQAELAGHAVMIEVSVKFAEDAEVRSLNAAYRGKDKPTNVLSFPMVQKDLLDTVTLNSDDGEVLLGDIILAHGVCVTEAAEKGVAVATHATHLIVHGTLHLLGHDHQDDAEAEAMEALERAALASLGIADPYAVSES
jgi:probable rRNA maturation factor